MPHPDDLLTATQAGDILGRSYRTVLRLADDGLLPIAHKLPGVNGAHLFRRGDVERLAAERNEQSA